MPHWMSDEPEYDSPFEEHPIAKLYRREYNAELMRLAKHGCGQLFEAQRRAAD